MQMNSCYGKNIKGDCIFLSDIICIFTTQSAAGRSSSADFDHLMQTRNEIVLYSNLLNFVRL